MAEMTEEERDLLLAQQKMEQVGAMLRTLVAPDSPGVGFVVLVRWLGRVVRRANLGVLHWLYANELLVTPEYCFAHWSEVRIPWRRG